MASWWTFAFQVLNFLVLVWLLQRFLYRPVQRTIAERQKRADQAATQVAEAQGAIDQARTAIEQDRVQAAAERERVLAETRGQARAEYDEALAKARAAAGELLAKASRTIEDERAAARSALEAHAADLGTAIAARLLGELAPAAGPALDEVFFAKIIACFDQLPRDRQRALAAEARAGVDVVTAHELVSATVARWTGELTTRLGEPAAISFHTEPALLAGVELHFRSAAMRFSWRDALGDAREVIKAHAASG